MKAIRFHQTGDADTLRYEDVDTPAAGPDQVLLRVAASAFNPADGGIRGGYLPFPVALPHIPGYDVAGTVVALGDGVTGLAVGDAVIGFLPMAEDGGAAEYVVAPAEALVAAPTGIPLADAAAIPSVGLTAWQAIFTAGGLEAGQRVLVNGAGGPVGAFAVQLAHRAGAHVIATASPRSRADVEANGADEIIDHTATTLLDAVTDQVDLLLNLAPITSDGFAALVPLVRDGGAVVSTTPAVETPSDESRGVRAVTIFVQPDRVQLSQLVELVDEGALRVDIAERVPLSELADLHRRSDAGEVHGKVVVIPPSA